jgi:hypothetical protein
MTQEQIFKQLTEKYGKVMTLEQATEAIDRITETIDVLNEEGHEFSESDIVDEIGHYILNEI